MTHIVDHSSGCKLRSLGVERGDTIDVARGLAVHGADHAQQAAELAAKEAGEQADTEAVEQTVELADEHAAELADREVAKLVAKQVDEQADQKVDERADREADGDSHGNDPTPGDKINNLRPHPSAEIFPLMATAEFDALVADIKQNGQLEPIVTYNNMILDGRHRYKACLLIGRKPNTTEWSGIGSPEAFVISMNMRRRHLTASQRAIIAAKLPTFGHGGNRSLKQAANLPLAISQKKAAEMVNVSERSVRLAVTVVAKCVPELVQAVERGDIAMSKAATFTELPKERQAEIATAGRRQANKTARRIKQNKAAKQRRKQTDDQEHHEDRHAGLDQPVLAETYVSAGDREIDRKDLIHRAKANALAAKDEHHHRPIDARDQFIASLLKKGRAQHRLLNTWRERALSAGWGETT